MRIAIGQLWQESNTLNPLPTTLAEFEAFGIYQGAELIERFADTNELGGFIQSLRAWPTPPEIVGLMRFAAWPSGPVDAATFKILIDRMLDALERAGDAAQAQRKVVEAMKHWKQAEVLSRQFGYWERLESALLRQVKLFESAKMRAEHRQAEAQLEDARAQRRRAGVGGG